MRCLLPGPFALTHRLQANPPQALISVWEDDSDERIPASTRVGPHWKRAQRKSPHCDKPAKYLPLLAKSIRSLRDESVEKGESSSKSTSEPQRGDLSGCLQEPGRPAWRSLHPFSSRVSKLGNCTTSFCLDVSCIAPCPPFSSPFFGDSKCCTSYINHCVFCEEVGPDPSFTHHATTVARPTCGDCTSIDHRCRCYPAFCSAKAGEERFAPSARTNRAPDSRKYALGRS